MTSYIENYGFTKTLIHDNKHKSINEVEWKGDYDGNIANIEVDINDNGLKEFVSMQLTNRDLSNIFGVQPVEIPIEKRLMNDFFSNKPYKYTPITLEGALIKRKSRKHKRKHSKRKKSRKHKHR